MQTVILNSDSESDLNLLIKLAKKIGIKTKVLSKTEMEEMSLVKAINEGKTGEYVDTDDFLNTLRK